MSLLPPIPTSFRAATALPPLIKLDRRTDVLLRTHPISEAASPQPPRRSKIWELAETLHCSIIGTCLSNAELRQTLARLGVKGIEAADAHELHVVGVMLAGRRATPARSCCKRRSTGATPLRSSNTPRPRTRRCCAGCGTNRCAAAIFPAPIGRC